MVYFVISLISLLLLSASVALIGYVVGTNFDRIVDALLGRPMARQDRGCSVQHVRKPVRTVSRRPLALRAAS